MNLQLCKDLLAERHLKVVGKTGFGVLNEYPISVFLNDGNIWRATITAEIEDWKALHKEMKAAGIKVPAAYDKGHLTLNLGIKKGNIEGTYDKIMSDVTVFLRQNGIHAPRTCPVCGQAGCDSLAFHQEGYDPIHRNCLEQMIGQVKEKAEENDLKGNYFTGLIGAILGAVVGVIPSVLSVVLTEKIYAILFALIPLCIYYGYKLFKGKLNKAVIAITVVLSVCAVYLIEILVAIASLVSELETPVAETAKLVFSSLSDPEMWSLMTQDSISSFVFIALGIWIAWGQISKTSQGEIKSAEVLRETVTSYGFDSAPQGESTV